MIREEPGIDVALSNQRDDASGEVNKRYVQQVIEHGHASIRRDNPGDFSAPPLGESQ